MLPEDELPQATPPEDEAGQEQVPDLSALGELEPISRTSGRKRGPKVGRARVELYYQAMKRSLQRKPDRFIAPDGSDAYLKILTKFRQGLWAFFKKYMPKERGYSDSTIENYYYCVGWLLEWLFKGKRFFMVPVDVGALSMEDVAEFKEYLTSQAVTRGKGEDGEPVLVRGMTPNYVNYIMWVCRSLFGFMRNRGYIRNNPFAQVEPIREQVKPDVQPVDETAVQTVVQAQEEMSPLALAVILGFYAGLRRSEIVSIRKGDIEQVEMEGKKALMVKVLGKGGKWRKAVVVKPSAIQYIEVYAVDLAPEDILVAWSDDAGNRVPYSPGWLSHKMPEMSASAGVPVFTPHQLRHGYATMLRNKGVPIDVVSALLGHANIQTTAKIYTQLSDERKLSDVFGALAEGAPE